MSLLVMQKLPVWRGFRACLDRLAALHNGGNSTGPAPMDGLTHPTFW